MRRREVPDSGVRRGRAALSATSPTRRGRSARSVTVSRRSLGARRCRAGLSAEMMAYAASLAKPRAEAARTRTCGDLEFRN